MVSTLIPPGETSQINNVQGGSDQNVDSRAVAYFQQRMDLYNKFDNPTYSGQTADGSTPYAGDNQLGVVELHHASIAYGSVESRTLRHSVGDGNGFLNMEEMEFLQNFEILKIEGEGENVSITLTEFGQEMLDRYNRLKTEGKIPEGMSFEDWVRQYDFNGGGVLTSQEQAFAKMDTNGDHTISQAEFINGNPELVELRQYIEGLEDTERSQFAVDLGLDGEATVEEIIFSIHNGGDGEFSFLDFLITVGGPKVDMVSGAPIITRESFLEWASNLPEFLRERFTVGYNYSTNGGDFISQEGFDNIKELVLEFSFAASKAGGGNDDKLLDKTEFLAALDTGPLRDLYLNAFDFVTGESGFPDVSFREFLFIREAVFGYQYFTDSGSFDTNAFLGIYDGEFLQQYEDTYDVSLMDDLGENPSFEKFLEVSQKVERLNRFNEYDSDGDEFISEEEFVAVQVRELGPEEEGEARNVFREVESDDDNDNLLSFGEFSGKK